MNLKNLYLLILLLPFSKVYGQCGAGFPYLSDLGTFNVSEIQGCAPLTVEVCINNTATCFCSFNPSDPCLCDVIFGNGDGDSFTATYSESGTYILEVIYPDVSGAITRDIVEIQVTDKIEPNFEVYSCTGNRVRVDLPNSQNAQYDSYEINFGDGTIIPAAINSDPVHTYPNNLSRIITVQGIDNNALVNCPIGSENFTPRNTLPVTQINRLVVLNDTQLELNQTLDDNILYRLEIQVNGIGSFTPLPSALSDSFIVHDLNLENNFYCFRIATVNPCNGQVTYSNTICSVNATLEIQDGNNALAWKTNDPTVTFYIGRRVVNSNGSNTTNRFQTVSPLSRSYNDMDITCNTDYGYFLEADYGNNIISVSDTVSGTAFTTMPPTAVNDLSIIIEPQQVVLDWTDQPNIIIDRYDIRSSFLIGSVESSDYIDNRPVGQEASICYNITTVDQCGNSSVNEEPICSIFLEGSITRDNNISLNWSNYIGFQNGLSSYRLEKFYKLNLVNTITTSDLTFSEVDNNDNEQVINYLVTAIPQSSTLAPAVSNLITFIKPNNIYHPTAFTPDGNESNDTFIVNARFIVDYNMQIFNRWGEMIFSSESRENGWDGTYNGQPQQEGTYVFHLELTDLAGRTLKKNGSFLLLRK